ncbi:acyl-CoA reductase [Pseudomonas sp.]|uniref:acyl-CoA reductase n=1 Tax=Pseudomonas sp. TaxID=306 RepID=UPI003981F522
MNELQQGLEAARSARRRVLEARTTEEIILALAKSAALWRNPTSQARRSLVPQLAQALRLAPGMVEVALNMIFAPLEADAIRALVVREAPGSSALEPTAGPARSLGPEVVAHRLAGNVPGQAIAPIVTCLLARSVCLLRESVRQPLLTDAFLTTLAEHDSDLAAMVITANWPATDPGTEAWVMAQASRIEVYGSDETVAGLSSRYGASAGIEIVTHGSRQSLAYVATGAGSEATTSALAGDIVMYEGQGCLSPGHIVVEGTRDQARRLAALLATALEQAEQSWPRQRCDLETEARRRGELARREWLAIEGGAGGDLTGKGEAWHISVDSAQKDTALMPGPGTRVVTVLAAGSRRRALALCRNTRHPLAGVALACSKDERAGLAASLTEAGATLVCLPGTMQAPGLEWRQDGGRRLTDLLSWQRGRAA